MNIVLIGIRGSGKTTVSKLLAKKLNKTFVEMDDLVIKKAGMTIPEIVKKHGWEYFRELESHVCKEVSQRDDCVMSTGGGVVLREDNVQALRTNGKLILLQTGIDTILKRIGDDKNRPSLTGKKSMKEDLEETLRQRENIYLDVSDLIVEADTKSPDEVADIIIENLKKI